MTNGNFGLFKWTDSMRTYQSKIKKASGINYLSLYLRLVIQTGFEPVTRSLEGCCSIQLSYWTALVLRRQR